MATTQQHPAQGPAHSSAHSPVQPGAHDLKSWWVIAGIGAAVIGVCYGFARYAYGLFAPDFAATFDLGPAGIGVLGGVSTAGYSLGLLLAPLVSTAAPRGSTIAAGACACVGLLTMGAAPVLPVFAVGLLVAGTSAGLVSPAVAQLVVRAVTESDRPRAQTWANIGTSLGLAASAFTPLLSFGWRVTWVGFGVVAGLVTVWTLLLPRTENRVGEQGSGSAAADSTGWRQPRLMPLLTLSLLLGVTSAPYWNFSIQRIQDFGTDAQGSAWFWFCIGAAGLLGGMTGSLATRFGLARVSVSIWSISAVSLMLLALPQPSGGTLFASAALFGTAFMALTGACILWGARLYPDRPARGVTLSFLFLGIGQTIGSPLAGAVAGAAGLGAVFAGAAALSLLAWLQLLPRLQPPAA